jgi:hypothetical protein
MIFVLAAPRWFARRKTGDIHVDSKVGNSDQRAFGPERGGKTTCIPLM